MSKMDDRDSILFISKIQPFFAQILKLTNAAQHSYFFWDEESCTMVLTKRKNLVKFTVKFHLVYILLQIGFTLKSEVTLSNKLISSGLIAGSALMLSARWEFEPDEAAIQTINELLHKKDDSYNLQSNCI